MNTFRTINLIIAEVAVATILMGSYGVAFGDGDKAPEPLKVDKLPLLEKPPSGPDLRKVHPFRTPDPILKTDPFTKGFNRTGDPLKSKGSPDLTENHGEFMGIEEEGKKHRN